jgi:outer membrane protein assembly factor BamB
MTTTEGGGGGTGRRSLRLWPGVVLVTLQWLGWFVLPRIAPQAALYAVLAGLLCGPAILVWWAFFSRAPRIERFGSILLIVATMAAVPRLLHPSVAKGNMGFQFFLYAIPVLSLAFVVWAVTTRRLADGTRRVTMAAAILLACGAFTLVRSRGLTGDGAPEFEWRWAETAEDRLLAQGGALPPAPPAPPPTAKAPEPGPVIQADQTPVSPSPAAEPAMALPKAQAKAEPASPSAPAAAEKEPDWPGFRGSERDGVVRGVHINTDWSASPPVELWRRPIGPGVSSFAVRGTRLYTQEQRGEEEMVACYNVTTGEPVWSHADVTRFWDSHVGAGPRSTPTLSSGRVYALGATGILNALDAADGTVVWSRNAASDTGAKLPTFGFASSPIVVDDLVIVHAGAIVAFDRDTGDPRWVGPQSAGTYSSPCRLTLDGVPQIMLMTGDGATSVALRDGTLLWEHAWPGVGILPPALTEQGDLLISMIDNAAMPIGTRRISVARGAAGWKVEERWTSLRLKPSFSPLVVHKGHAFGFDGGFLASIDVEKGERKWKGGRYGSGQLLLLPDQDLLLVVTEQGELALVRAVADAFTELARVPAIEGKTWNQPALVGDVLLVRNGQEMAAFRLALEGR